MQAISSSYKDPNGFVFLQDGIYYRSVHSLYKLQYMQLMQSGLYEKLIQIKLLIPHEEVEHIPLEQDQFVILKPVQLPLISYAYEWSFSMLQDAAICTLQCALEAISFGMILKDANTFNIQFLAGKPVLIDTLSFDIYNPKESWIAYRQFCEHFVAPLLLMKYNHTSLNKLLIAYPNGIPLSVCASMLPMKARLNIHAYLHIFLQQIISTKGAQSNHQQAVFSQQKLLHLLHGLISFIQKLKAPNAQTTWDNYYAETILSKDYLARKKELVSTYLQRIPFDTLLDLGANDGEFSLLYQNTNKTIIAVDEDRNCIEHLYQFCKKNNVTNIHPLIVDLTVPSPSLGWNIDERPAIFSRIKADVTLALALIHHLAIANNLPLEKIISFFHSLSEYLIIEFVDKQDPKVQELLQHREDIFPNYTRESFENILRKNYEIIQQNTVGETLRTIYLLKRK